jgi:hypothetical protein
MARRNQHDLSPDQEQIRREGEAEPDDPTTQRERLELDLMEQDESEQGERIGDQID